jgi:nucleotide-binding universal stress UspA family protein
MPSDPIRRFWGINPAEKLRAAGFRVTHFVHQGGARTVILDHAVKIRTDANVLGSHGRKEIERFLMGRVSKAVVPGARCSVLIARTLAK